MNNAAEIAKALFQAQQEYKTVKRNKSGSINENSAYSIRKRLVANLMAVGESEDSALAMASDLRRQQQ